MQVVKEFIATIADLRTKRLAICNVCPSNEYKICTKCACFIEAKVLLENSTCPLDKW